MGLAFTDTENNQKELYPDFLASLEAALPRKEEKEKEQDEVKELDPELQAIVDSSDCPYLSLALQQVFLAVPDIIKEQEPEPVLELLPNTKLDPLLPLEPLLRRALAPTIQSHYSR